MYDPGIEILSDDCIALHRNENLFIDPDFMLSFLCKDCNLEINKYPDSVSHELREALAKKYACSPSEIYVGNGADGVLADILCLLRNEFSVVGLQKYTYQVYPYLCERYNFHIKSYLDTNQIWLIDSPNSINGQIFDFNNIKNFPSYIVWDNVYGEFDTSYKAFKPNNKKIIRVNSFSKFYGLAGLRVGYCIADQEFVAALLNRKDIYNVNKAAQKMTLIALENSHYFNSFLSELNIVKSMLSQALSSLGFSVTEGNANFISVFHKHIKASVIQQALERKGVIVRHFNVPIIDKFLRITVPPKALLNRVIDAFSDVVKSLSST